MCTRRMPSFLRQQYFKVTFTIGRPVFAIQIEPIHSHARALLPAKLPVCAELALCTWASGYLLLKILIDRTHAGPVLLDPSG